jgi:iduronate 2-sulfatase
VELTFAQKLREAFPDKKIALLKYSRGGTSIDEAAAGVFGSWDPQFVGGEGAGKGVNQYDHFLAAVRNAYAAGDIDGDGEADTLVPKGILWMQGESDGDVSEESAKRYRAKLGELMNLIRAAFRYDDLPVVIGRISDSGNDPSGKVWEWGDVIREAQASFAQEDGHAALVGSTDDYGYSDPWHYDSAGYVDLGGKFAEATVELMK